MGQIVELDDNYSDIQEIRRTAIEIADAPGGLGREYLRKYYDELCGK